MQWPIINKISITVGWLIIEDIKFEDYQEFTQTQYLICD